MLNIWPILIGGLAIILMTALPIVAIVRRQLAWLVVAAIVVSPYALYLLRTPRFGWLAPMFPLLLIGAGIAIRRSRPCLAWSFFILYLGSLGWVAITAVGE